MNNKPIILFIISCIQMLIILCLSLNGCSGVSDFFQDSNNNQTTGETEIKENHPPVLEPIGDKILSRGESLQFTVSATDPDGDDMVYSASNLPTRSNFDTQTGIFTWSPEYEQSGNYPDVLFKVTDNGTPPKSDHEYITITVGKINRPPTIDSIGDKEIYMGEILQFTVSATDPDGDDMIFSISDLPAEATFNNSTGIFSWTPGAGQSGIFTICFTVNDTGTPSESDSETITISVGNTNRPPALDPIGNKIVNEGELLEFSITATDPEGDDLIFSASNLPSGSSFNPDTQIFSWTPTPDQSGNYVNVLFTVTDIATFPESDSEAICITVGDINRPPVLDPIGNKTVNEGELLEFTITASDPDGNDLFYSASNLPLGANFDMENKVFSWTPNYNDSGNYNDIIFTVTDDGTPPENDSESISISVGDINRPPVLYPIGDRTADEGVLLTFTLQATDIDGHNLTYSGSNLPSGAYVNPITGLFSWTPSYDQSGNHENIVLTVTDDGIPTESDSETINIMVGDVNRPPVLDPIGDSIVTEGELLEFIITASDPDAGNTLTYTAENLPLGADFDADTQVFSWIPDNTQSGIYPDILFTVSDDGFPELTDSEVITITVINDWWDSSWSYRNRISITEEAHNGDLTDFQINMFFDSSNLNFDHVSSNDGDDIRFTYYDTINHEEIEINYWIETWNNGLEETSIWVNVPLIPSGGETMLYLYYGNQSAEAVSDFDCTFTKDFDTPGLVGLWHMDEGSGNTIGDSSGNNNTGTNHYAGWVGADGGRWGDSSIGFSNGDSLDFDGGSDYVLVPDNSSLDLMDITIEAWCNPDDLFGFQYQYFVSKYDISGQRSYALAVDQSSNSIRFLTSFDGYNYNNLQGGSLSTGTWYHVVGTFDGTTKRLYVNGVLVNTTFVSGILHFSTADLTIGTRSDLNSNYDFNGTIDEVAIYDRALSTEEIRAHYERRKHVSTEPTLTIDEEEYN
ncbi:MAG: DUF2341 domain-containing protein [Spirochaetota bacterium]|nr:DUF2341 domain-containing protein [Spirochaetota bacterium]